MIYVIIGQAGSGKTTFAKRHFLQGELQIVKDILPYTTNGKICGIGKYGIGKRCEGTDTCSMSSQIDIIEQVKKLTKEGKSVLVEGERILNKKFFEYLVLNKNHVMLIYLYCSVETSMRRLCNDEDSDISLHFLKSTITKSRNKFKEYRKFFITKIICTDKDD